MSERITHGEKLTISVDADLRQELAAWAAEEGRPVSNLLRRLVARSLEQRRQQNHPQAA